MLNTIKDKILDNISFGVLVISFNEQILFVNNICKNMLNITDSNSTKSNIFTIFPKLKKIINDSSLKTCAFKEHIFSATLKNKFICEISPFTDNDIHIGYLILIKNTDEIINISNYYNINNTRFKFDDIIGQSPQMERVIEQCKEIANLSSTILITGESGCGKELLAQSIHNSSSQKNGPFIAVNCGAIPKSLIESELFGYESGAFTGAIKGGAPGKFELADGGTIFLDEIGEMPLEMQVHLLRVLQEGKVTRIAGKTPINVNVRVIAATNKDLKEEVKKGNFRSDLFYRLNVLPINVPPLKDRIGDVPLLLDHFLKTKSQKLHKPIPTISQKLFKKMISYCWPGNVRELENFVENLVALNGITTYELDLEECHCLTHDNLGNIIKQVKNNNETALTYDEKTITPLVTLEQNEIIKAISICSGNMTKVASKLGISRNALYNKIKRYGISIDR